MIQFHHQTDFRLPEEREYADWVLRVMNAYGTKAGDLNYIFCTDEELLAINREYLQHDYYTDIVTFPYEAGSIISGDIFISVDRVSDNARKFKVPFESELKRVMIHGVLHLLGFGDKGPAEAKEMRQREEHAMQMFHVKH